MYINAHMVKLALKELGNVHDNFLKENSTDEIAEVIVTHSLGAAAAGLGSAWIPGAGGVAALLAAVGFVWSMYYRINKCLGLKLSKTLLKSLASAILTNIIASAIGIITGVVAAIGLSFIPGIGNVAASLVMAGLDYAIVLVSGIIYIKLLTNLFKTGRDPSKMTEEEFKAEAEAVIKNEDIGKIIKEAKKEYVDARKSGDITGEEKVDLEEDE